MNTYKFQRIELIPGNYAHRSPEYLTVKADSLQQAADQIGKNWRLFTITKP